MKRPAVLILALALSIMLTTACGVAASPIGAVETEQAQATITLDSGITYQTMVGWEAVAEIGDTDFPYDYHLWQDEVIDLAANDLGINRIRLQVKSGNENPTDYFTAYVLGSASISSWKSKRYEIVNDNDDPFSINWSGFNFSTLDHAIESVVLPLKQQLDANDERLYVNLNYVDFEASAFEQYSNPEEYAEFILAAFIHMRDKYGLVPNAIEMILEPDNSKGWSGTQIGEALVATARRLEANGFAIPDFIGPSTKGMGDASDYFDEMLKVPGVSQYMTELSYHRYSNVSDRALRAIGSRAEQHGVRTGMLEKIGAGYRELHDDIKIGQVSSWQQFTLAYPAASDKGGAYFVIDTSNPSNPRVNMGKRTRFLRQYFKFIRSGAVRIEASTTNESFDPVAFINENGAYVVVVKADDGGKFTIEGLPAGAYGIKYTTPQSYDVDLDDIIVVDSTLTTSIPSEGVITIYGKQGP